MKFSSFQFSRLQKFLSGFLIFLLFFSQTIQVNWFQQASAGVGNYRDIVSIVVDRDTYDQLQGDIKQYAKNIQKYLGQTRTALVVVDPNTPPAVIATQNETLYYEGDSTYSGPSQLVGTILIGNIPVPMVAKEGSFFPSLYPYVDFKEKVFVYDEASRTYKKSSETSFESPEVWHGVINPAVGREWKGASDIQKIKAFLSKTNLFYNNSGTRFPTADTEPRVFYYDGFTESRSVDARSLYQYELYIKNLENLAYNRYSKYLLRDINNALKAFDMSGNENYDELIQTVIATNTGGTTADNEAFRKALTQLSGGSTLTDESFKNVPDIQTINHINEFLKPFNKIFNKKVLGDELRAVYNAGRYTSGSTVRADIAPFTVTVMDKVAQDTIRATNNALENSIEQAIKNANIIRPVVILDSYDYQRNKYTSNESSSSLGGSNSSQSKIDKDKYHYDNYYFGELARNITSATGCTIARGGHFGGTMEFGKEVRVEANTAFDVHSAKPQLDLLKADNDELKAKTGRNISCYRSGGGLPVKIDSYWGGNSVLRISGNTNTDYSAGKNPVYDMPAITTFTGFTLSIYTLAGMRETNRLSSPSLSACIEDTYRYTLRTPSTQTVSCTIGGENNDREIVYSTAYPKEWNIGAPCNSFSSQGQGRSTIGTPRYTCMSDPMSGSNPGNFRSEFTKYKKQTVDCLVGDVSMNGSVIATSRRSCIETKQEPRGGDDEGGGTITIDRTTYKNIAYHAIPGYMKHESPTQIELQAAAKSGVTPNLAIDTQRSFEFQTPKGNIATIVYPNFFRHNFETVQQVRDFLKQESQRQWADIILKEQNTPLSAEQATINANIFKIGALSRGFDWNDFISDADIIKLLQAMKWKHPDVTKKYKQAVETMLSYSHKYPNSDQTNNPPKITNNTNKDYEIAYLGLTPFEPEMSDGVAGFSASQQAYNIARQKIHAINITDQESRGNKDEKSSTECGPPDGVMIWKWPSAIMCWIRNMFPIKIISGKCSGKTIGGKQDKKPNNITGLSDAEQKTQIDGAILVSHLPREVLSYQDSLQITAGLETTTGSLILPVGTKAKITLISLLSDGKDVLSNSGEYLSLSPMNQEVQGGNAQFIVSSKGKPATAKLQIIYTIPVGGEKIIKKGEEFTLTVSDSYLQINLSQGGKPTYALSSDSQNPSILSAGIVSQKNTTQSTLINNFEVTLYDDITNTFIASGSVSDGKFILPESITKKSGSYRVEVLGDQKQYGSLIFSVMAGEFSKIDIQTVSTAIIGEESLPVRIRLLDNSNNVIEPKLHTMKLSVEGGNILLSGNEKKSNLEMDIIRGYADLNIQADGSGNPVKITVDIDGKKSTKEITTHKTAQLKFIQNKKPQAGGDPVLVKVQILGNNGNPIDGFNSVFSASFSQGGGEFEREVISIKNGESQPVNYTPGTQAGKIPFTLAIPGYGTREVSLDVDPGEAMYIDHSIIGNTIEFSLRDRYGNIASKNTMNGSIQYNSESEKSISFTDGKYTTPRKSGYYQITVPDLENQSIEIIEKTGACGPLPANPTQEQVDAKNACKVSGIPKYSTHIRSESQTKFDFLPDYNARYTVLAGGSFLREAEDILYNSDSNNSQSLATTTLLDSPYSQETLFNILPGGATILGTASDVVLSSSLKVQNNSPVLTVIDEVDNTVLANVFYSLQNAQILTSCQNVQTCTKGTGDFVAVSKSNNSDIAIESKGSTVVFTYKGEEVASIGSDGSLVSNGLISLDQVLHSSANGLHFYLNYQGTRLAEVLYHSDEGRSISLGKTARQGEIVLDAKKGKTISFSQQSFASQRNGYKILGKQKNRKIIDSNKLGPNGITSIGELSETPNIGWQGDNTMMLSYAAGDTVGQATYRYHTYMMINMGDPVAHVQNGRKGTQIDGIDRTVGAQIGSTRKTKISKVLHRDMNNDGLQDIVVVYSDGYIELLLNFGDRFRSRDMIAYIPPRGKNIIDLGDFTGDSYADIVAVGQSGALQLWNNTNRKLVKQDITVNNSDTPYNITQMKVYDMDNDGKDDIVYLTSGGKLAVLYGTSTAGTFDEVILDSTLGISLSPEVFTDGGALYGSNIEQISSLGTESIADTGATDTMIKSLIYYQQILPNDTGKTVSTEVHDRKTLDGSTITETITTTQIDHNYTPKKRTFMRSAYLTGINMLAEKRYESSQTLIQAGEKVTVTLKITNNTSQNSADIQYLDTIPRIFDSSETKKYTISLGGNAPQERDFERLYSGEYDTLFDIGTLAPGQSATITYSLKVLPASYGEMIVDDFEKSTSGADNYGDVAFKTDTTCGGNMLLYLSTAVRSYTKTTNNRDLFEPELPDGVKDRLTDADGNGIPDSVEGNNAGSIKTSPGKVDIDELTSQTRADLESQYDTLAHQPESDDDSLIQFNQNGTLDFSIDFNPDFSQKVEQMAEDFFNGLACGFGGGSCMSFPLNWAPLAPGSDPVAFGIPIGDGLKVGEGMPIFSALTWRQTMCGKSPCCLPSVYPASVQGAGGAICGPTSAGGYLGTWDATNTVRVFVTPTLTLGMGMAVCFGGPASAMGQVPPPGLFPLIQSGNCIVVAKAMPFCKGDGSSGDGDVSPVMDSSNTWNADSCDIQVRPQSQIQKTKDDIKKDVIDYLRSPAGFDFLNFNAKLSKGNISSLNSSRPLLQISPTSGGGQEVIDISIDSNTDIADFGKIVNLKNKRIAGFPDFIMDWVARQTEEITNALFTPPNLTIIPPKDLGQNAKVDSTYKDFWSDLGNAYSKSSFDDMKQRMGSAYNGGGGLSNSLIGKPNSWLGQKYAGMLDKGTSTLDSGVKKISGGLNAVQEAYKFLGNLPFIKITQARVNINIPWVLPSELDQYERQINDYMEEIERVKTNWCISDPSPECLAAKAKLNSSGLTSSWQANLSRIQEYRKFPEKLKKYLNWKEKYLYELMCNVEAIQRMVIGWLKDNGIRFQKWAELFVLLKAIAETWQPVLDIFANTSAQCGVCRNERYNSQYWKFKLISIIIPKVPVIQFPRWPDIILDLSDVRLGINIVVPEFSFRISPIRLPRLPSLSLPDSPTGSLTLPSLPVLPKLPTLPDLPDLPSLPLVDLPDLPPPPKLPKLFGSVKVAVNIMKLISKLYCFYQKTSLVPEWNAGDVIAQRTERQGTLPMDFLDISYPTFKIPGLKSIKISTHVNFELKADFLAEMARAAVKPINSMSSDFQRAIPNTIGSDISIESPIPDIHIKPTVLDKEKNKIQGELDAAAGKAQDASDSAEDAAQESVDEATKSAYLKQTKILAKSLESMGGEYLDIDEFAQFFTSQLEEAGLESEKIAFERDMQATRTKVARIRDELIHRNNKKFELIKHTLKNSQEDIAIGNNIIEALRGNKDMKKVLASSKNSYLLASDSQENSSRYNQVNTQLDTLSQIQGTISLSKDAELYNATKSIERRYNNIVAQNTTGVSTATVGSTQPIAQNYSPKFKGIYILTPIQKKQTRLFDYTEPVNKKTKVSVVDIDRDGDNDFLFVLDNRVYIKYNYTKNPTKIIDESTSQISLDVNSPLPFVPDYFDQNFSTPSQLNITFQPADMNTNQWRLEFYDQYLDWFRAKDGESVGQKMTIDLFVEEGGSPNFENAVATSKVKRSLNSGFDTPNFKLEGPNIVFLTGTIDLSLSSGRAIYTGKRDVQAKVDGKDMTLQKHTKYQFENTVSIIAESGPLFVIGNAEGYKMYEGSKDLEGLPILPGMKMISEADTKIQNHTTNTPVDIPKNGYYISRSLGTKSESYSFTIDYPDGYYYARLHNLSNTPKDRAGIVLLAPNEASDKTPPVIALEEVQRIPVYTTKTIDLKERITELSSYSVSIDSDTSVDSDGDGDNSNDFGLGNGASISNFKLTLGKFDAPGQREMLLRVVDAYGSTTEMPLTVEIYTPIPHITDATFDGTLTGTINENIEAEPIHIFRLRSPEEPIFLSTGASMTDGEGIFKKDGETKPEVITLTASGQSFEISPYGAIKNLPAGFTTSVVSANKDNPMTIEVRNSDTNLVYEQTIVLPESAKIINTNEDTTSTGLLVSAQSGFKAVSATLLDPSIPNGMYITDTSDTAILALANDGNIYSLDDVITLSLSHDGEYIKIVAKKENTEIANFVYKIDFYYTK